MQLRPEFSPRLSSRVMVHGCRRAGLLAYLLGPGTAVHRAPRVIASWDGLDAGWQPASTGLGEYDLALGPLITALHAPVFAAGLPTRAPADRRLRGEPLSRPWPISDHLD